MAHGYDYDLITLGAGSGGTRASRVAGAYGAKVAVIEEVREGGTCVLRGCVPKKLFIYGSHFLEEAHDAQGYGWSTSDIIHDWAKMVDTKNKELDRLHGIYVRLLQNAGCDRINGRGTIVDAHTVAVGDRRLTAERILVAVGGWPVMPDVPGIEHAISSNEALDLRSRPERIVVVGSGYIAVEFAGIFRAFGSTVDLVFRADMALRGFDQDVREVLTEEMTKKGINFRPGCLPDRIEKVGDEVHVHLNDGNTIVADAIMYATGRALHKGLGLEEVGVEMKPNGAIVVDQDSRTSVPSIFAIGDVTDRVNLTPVAIMEGRCFAETFYNDNPMSPDHDNVPSAVFSQPPIGSVGLPEHAAREKYGEIDVYVAGFRPMSTP